ARSRRAKRGDALMARVLVVEDDANNLDVASRIIRASGHEALVAADGVAGLEVARVERPDAILVDLLLPRMDGWSLTRSLRTEPWASSIPIIAVSALALPSDRARAIALAKTEQPDLILLDVMMPGIDGWQTCRRLKSQPETADIPVIFVTARDRSEDVSKGFEVGGVDYISKPIEPIELSARVRSAI